MTIHQAKGLEFPIVIIPELQRYSRAMDNWFLLDRHRGLTLKVPDGRGKLVAGCTFSAFEQRHAWREQFESMRLLYVAATRAQDRLILSGTTKDIESLSGNRETWARWIWQSLDLKTPTESGIINLTDDLQIQFSLNLAQGQAEQTTADETPGAELAEPAGSLAQAFPLMRAIEPESTRGWHRFSVTQLINYRRCPRQYYFDRVLHVPSTEEMAVWNNAEAPEPPANLTATLKGAVIHRFCETYAPGEDPLERLRQSFADLIRLRQAQFADRLIDINAEEAVQELLPLANSYLSSALFERVNQARVAGPESTRWPGSDTGLWSELGFRLRRPLGILTGAIDKLLVTKSGDGGFEIEIVDFKTNRFRARSVPMIQPAVPERRAPSTEPGSTRAARSAKTLHGNQIAFDFSIPETTAGVNQIAMNASSLSLADEVARVASDYQLQMQAYALAVRELFPAAVTERSRIRVTLHFLDPNVEYSLPQDLLGVLTCAQAIDDAMTEIVAARHPENFPVHPARHCRRCNFLELCAAGRDWLSQQPVS